MDLSRFLGKQFLKVIQWNEPQPGILAWRYPMQDQEIENGQYAISPNGSNTVFCFEVY